MVKATDTKSLIEAYREAASAGIDVMLQEYIEGQELTADDPATVMMITGLEDSESIKKALEVGALDYVTKPIQPFVLTFRLRRLLDSVETQKALHKYQKTIEHMIFCLKLSQPLCTIK